MHAIVRQHFWKVIIILLVILAALLIVPRLRTPPPTSLPQAPSGPAPKAEHGKASFYGGPFDGEMTASGEIYDEDAYTAAHRRLPMGTEVRVKNLKNGREVTVRINNRGPYIKGRIIDLSKRAARELGMLEDGVVPVDVTVVDAAPRPEKE